MSLDTERAELYALDETEYYWRDQYNWFLKQGYQLRPRYRPSWTPSWQADNQQSSATAEE
ncbi:hypothetical protein FA15DRAFT_671128 [Coprinopsis marcescibilis]|uniref:Uncharacterized protein n=1 Tax=Coprinopsis marcescibilis TaxID=230819 RepID=A0A5C3KQG9_COPMA|nr:hypothetical protein FA15DRAFT_671128 [Coprinopsis marcescibilis]